MHTQSIEAWRHDHAFLGLDHSRNERRVWLVVGLTTSMMVLEIAGGTIFGSLALLADGWHMSTHAAALAISALAYSYAKRHLRDERFSFGTGKLGYLASFSSAVILAMIALLIGYESVQRLVEPVSIAYTEAISIAVLGLAINLVSALLLGDGHGRAHAEDHDDGHNLRNGRGARDLNLRAAYVHVLADAVTSVLAIVGLLTARFLGWHFMDPLVGLVGTAVILSWAYGLIRESGAVLLDTVPDRSLSSAVKARLEVDGDRVTDQHMWRVGTGHYAVVLTIVSDDPRAPSHYKQRLCGLEGLSHVTVEVEACTTH